MPVDPFVIPSIDPAGRGPERLAELERRIAALERATGTTMIASDGSYVRVEVGYLSGSNKYGIRVYSSSGVLTHDYTTAA